MPLNTPITPHLWFDTQAREATAFYCSVFPDSRIDSIYTLHDTPSGDCDAIAFTLAGQPFMAISAGPYFKFNPAISLLMTFDPARDAQALERMDAIWRKLIDGGQALMDLGGYPFAKRFGWLQDRYGLSWQFIVSEAGSEPRSFIMPALMFTGDVVGKAGEAGEFYRSVFDDSRPGKQVRWPEGSSPDNPGTMMMSDFQLDGDWFFANDSAHPHGFGFNEAISFIITCRDQAEIERYWAQLSSVPESEQCGWCKDRYGVSWQITPQVLEDLMNSGDQKVIDRVSQAVLKMHKLDVAKIEAAGRG